MQELGTTIINEEPDCLKETDTMMPPKALSIRICHMSCPFGLYIVPTILQMAMCRDLFPFKLKLPQPASQITTWTNIGIVTIGFLAFRDSGGKISIYSS
jgi:hypothetical protein